MGEQEQEGEAAPTSRPRLLEHSPKIASSQTLQPPFQLLASDGTWKDGPVLLLCLNSSCLQAGSQGKAESGAACPVGDGQGFLAHGGPHEPRMASLRGLGVFRNQDGIQ